MPDDTAASDLIDRHCERTFGTVSESRYFAPSDGLLCQVDDLAGDLAGNVRGCPHAALEGVREDHR